MGRRTDGRMGQAAELFFLPLIRDHAGNKGAAGNGAVRAWHGRQAAVFPLSLSLSWTKQVGSGSSEEVTELRRRRVKGSAKHPLSGQIIQLPLPACLPALHARLTCCTFRAVRQEQETAVGRRATGGQRRQGISFDKSYQMIGNILHCTAGSHGLDQRGSAATSSGLP